MSTSTAVLMKKGKRGAAAYIHADCAGGSPQHLGPLLDVLLNPSKNIDDWDTFDWCRWLIAGGRTPDEFAAIVRSYDNHDKCGLVWIPRVVAYRCRTCGISPCMSICRECFHRGDHSTHDFNMFLSQAGGACDCGDKSVMKEDGFCSNHGNKCHRPTTAPTELMCVAEAMMPRVILRLLQHFREHSWGEQANSNTYSIAVQECESFINMLMEFNNMGDLMRKAMTKALINPQMYRNLVEPPFAETPYGCYMEQSKKMYEKAIESFPAPEPPEEYRSLPALGAKLQHNTLLEEFIFWTFKYEFPQNVVCFLLNMLPDQDYKEHLTRTFVLHYARIPLVLEASADPDTLSNRVVHMSVQLFSNEALALRCVQQLHLLHVMVVSLRLMMGKILIPNTLHDPNKNFHLVIDCAKRVMKEHCYWPLVSDLNNVLSHRSVALVFLQDDSLIEMWFEFLSMLQGMNVNEREVGGHIEYEPSSYYAAFSCELEAAAYPMWSVIAHLTAPEHAPLARRIMSAALTYLQDWLDAVHSTAPHMDRSEVMRASFHYPLHRYLAAFLCQAVRFMDVQAKDVLPPPDLLALLMMHPLRVQSLFYEILSGIWVRNGLQIKGQAMTYIQANFCNSMVDMDIYFLQVCAAHLPKDQFINTCIDMFGVREWLSMSPLTPTQAVEQDAMVEGLLAFLAILVSSRTNLGNDELTQSRLEISTLLATGDKTHSQLLELMPERSGNAHTRNFETVLKELSTYRPPPRGSENLEQGLFVPRDEVWEKHYDPLHVLQRAVHRRDFQSSMDRFTAYVREKRKSSEASTSTAPPTTPAPTTPPGEGAATLWPPLRRARAPPPGAGDPRTLCASGTLQAALLSVLHRGVHCRARSHEAQDAAAAPHAPPDHVLALAVYLLEVAADLAAEQQDNTLDRPVCITGGGCSAVRGKPLLSAFSSESVCQNVRTVIASVPRAPRHTPSPPQPATDPYPAAYHSDSDTEWDASEADNVTLVPRITAPVSNAVAVPEPMQVAVSESGGTDGASGEEAAGPVARTSNLRRYLQVLLQEDESESYPLALTGIEDTEILPFHEDMAVMLPEEMAVEAIEDYDWSVSLPTPSPTRIPPALPSTSTTHRTNDSRRVERLPAPPDDDDMVPVNESILSLLLKLHSQLSGRLDSFSLEESQADHRQPTEQNNHLRIGDGPHFIGNLLTKMAALDGRCASAIGHIRATLWPHQRERQAEQRARERREKEERSRRAKERQQKLMQDFAQKQKQFMNVMKAMESEDGGCMEWGEEEEPVVEREYDCVICNTTTPSTPANPIGLVVLLQSTSVLGHRRREGSEGGRLALSEAEFKRLPSQRETTAAAHHYRLHEEMQQQFDQESWLLSVSVGWEGGVHVQSCGHHLHLHCLHAYLRSLTNPQRPHNLHIERGEFLCPVCRQLANSVLPLSPGSGRPALPRGAPPDIKLLCQDIHSMLAQDQQPPTASKLSEAMGKAMEDMTSMAGGKLKQRLGSSPAAIFTFVASLARTNLESELVQRGGALVTPPRAPRYKPRKDCIVPLLVVLGAHARVLRGAGGGALGAAETWTALCPPPAPDPNSTVAPTPPVIAPPAHPRCLIPLLLRDPLALLMHFLLLAPNSPNTIEMPYYTCMVRILYKLTYYQVVAQLAAGMSAAGRAALTAPDQPGEPQGIRRAARVLLGALAGSELFTEDGLPATPDLNSSADRPDIRQLEIQLQELCLPFLRIAALLRHHLYGEELPDIQTSQQEFVRLVYYLELVTEGMEWSEFSAWRAVWSGATGGGGNARVWAARLGAAAARCQIGVRRLLREQHLVWVQPALLALPRDYDRLFTYYHERNCSQCGAVPKEASVCLLCGALVCLKQACCRQQDVCEAVQHAMECGGGTGIFLVVTSTYIIVIRGRRACLWGSLYLDDYDEEDRDLKRGKPLYLSQDRFELLESQWLAHRFDHTKRTWVWHRDSL